MALGWSWSNCFLFLLNWACFLLYGWSFPNLRDREKAKINFLHYYYTTKFSKVLQKKRLSWESRFFLLSMEQHKNNKKNLQKIKRKNIPQIQPNQLGWAGVIKNRPRRRRGREVRDDGGRRWGVVEEERPKREERREILVESRPERDREGSKGSVGSEIWVGWELIPLGCFIDL